MQPDKACNASLMIILTSPGSAADRKFAASGKGQCESIAADRPEAEFFERLICLRKLQMSKLLTAMIAVTFVGISFSVPAADDMKMKEGKMGMMDMKMMDGDKDGMVSENEMMMMFKTMDKDKNGMLDMNEQKMMMSSEMMKDDKMMKDETKK